MKKPRYVLIGGFLGAGKTTAMIRLAEYLTARDVRVGLITNDQSVDLVDTARISAAGFPVEEVTGSCFCCNFDALVGAAERLESRTAPQVIIAEPVGSCTDLRATVSLPLRRLSGTTHEVAPLSVMVDPVRCGQEFGMGATAAFSEKVLYIYRKQLEEADFIVINKLDLIDDGTRDALMSETTRRYPNARVFAISCRTGDGLDAWFEAMLAGWIERRATMDVDYDTYADGEALLGWLNATASVTAPTPFDGDEVLHEFAERLRRRLAAQRVEIAHLKASLRSTGRDGLGAVSATSTDVVPTATHTIGARIERGELIVNVRAEAAPDLLRTMVTNAMRDMAPIAITPSMVRAFRPGRPNPTHRVVSTVA